MLTPIDEATSALWITASTTLPVRVRFSPTTAQPQARHRHQRAKS
jgi:hypothetical protein